MAHSRLPLTLRWWPWSKLDEIGGFISGYRWLSKRPPATHNYLAVLPFKQE
ncbi:MAG: hypothetical protein ACOX4K_11015 [Bacillota bacterium]|jgi:hypothetical protein